MGNPFKKIVKNANETRKDWGENTNSTTSTRTCENCGAARPKDTNLTTCDYCDFRFMEIDNEIKTDI